MRVNETRTISLVRISPRFGSMQQWLPGRILRAILLLLLPVSAHAQTRTACLIVDELTKVEMVLHRVIDHEPVGQQEIDKTRQIFEQTELRIAQVEGRDDIEAYVFRFAEDYIADRRRIFDLFEILSSSQIRARATSVGARLISNRLTAMQSGQGCASDGNSFELADDDDQQDADDPAIQSNAADTQSTLLSLPSTAPRQSRGVIQRVYASYMNIHRDIRMLIFSCLVGSMMSLALYSGVRINRRRERRAKRYRCAVDIKIGYQEEEEEAWSRSAKQAPKSRCMLIWSRALTSAFPGAMKTSLARSSGQTRTSQASNSPTRCANANSKTSAPPSQRRSIHLCGSIRGPAMPAVNDLEAELNSHHLLKNLFIGSDASIPHRRSFGDFWP